jgi:hypothetical protein
VVDSSGTGHYTAMQAAANAAVAGDIVAPQLKS